MSVTQRYFHEKMKESMKDQTTEKQKAAIAYEYLRGLASHHPTLARRIRKANPDLESRFKKLDRAFRKEK